MTVVDPSSLKVTERRIVESLVWVTVGESWRVVDAQWTRPKVSY